jgi:bifunctional UDP-N-acetylglucosamine pyrophosphorylase/glucosamine-1-phosphate N-acetyltransferase
LECVTAFGRLISSNLQTERKGEIHDQAVLQGDFSIGEGSINEPRALIIGPIQIGRNCSIGHGAILRNNVIIGDYCEIGHAVEIKNSLLFNSYKVPYFNYVGDSILGYQVHLGAGAKLSNYCLILGKVNVIFRKERD